MIMRSILCIIFVFNFNILLSQEWDFDITDSNNPSYVISLDQQSSLQGLFCTYQTIESTDTTFFPEFLCLYVMPIDLLKFPYKGKNRKIE